jgi:AraC-like DNA-binding protein
MSFFLKYKKLLFILFPVLPLAIAFLSIYKAPIDLVPLAIEGKEVGFAVFDDSNNGGKSLAHLVEKNNSIVFTYTLEKGITFPYSGISFFSKKHPYFDFSDYSQVKVRIQATQGKRIPFVLYTHIENYSRSDNFNSLQNNQVILNGNIQETQEFEISWFKAPEWWYNLNPKYEKNVPIPDYSRVKNINLLNSLAISTGISDLIRIEAICFSVNLIPYFIGSLLFLLVYYSAAMYLLKKRKKPQVNFIYEKTEHVNYRDKEEEAVFNFITSNYHRTEITIGEIQNATGIYEQKISSMIRTKTGLSFKQFLNKLRISEAKRLLRETDLQVSEIAFKVGYGNVSHFHRVFKENEHCSPNESRKQGNGIPSLTEKQKEI